MCEYCKIYTNEEKKKSPHDFRIQSGITEKAEEISLGLLGKIFLSLDLQISEDEENSISAFLYNDYCDYKISQKINYCPFCGRKLSNVAVAEE